MEDIYVAIGFPDIQKYMDIPGFKDNSILINDEPLLSQYGSNAYLVNQDWLLAVEHSGILKEEVL